MPVSPHKVLNAVNVSCAPESSGYPVRVPVAIMLIPVIVQITIVSKKNLEDAHRPLPYRMISYSSAMHHWS